jgi:nitroreductase
MAMDNEILRAIKARRSKRNFTGEQVSPKQLDALLEGAANIIFRFTFRLHSI